MKYTVQLMSESGSFSCCYPDDVEYADGMEGLRELLDYWTGQHEKVGSDATEASLWVHVGYIDSFDYPDFIVAQGPRGGLVKRPA